MSPNLYRPEEACCALGISRPTLFNWIRQGRIKAIKIRGHLRISEDEIVSFIDGEQMKDKASLSNVDGAVEAGHPSGN